jgi:hypothetical protein
MAWDTPELVKRLKTSDMEGSLSRSANGYPFRMSAISRLSYANIPHRTNQEHFVFNVYFEQLNSILPWIAYILECSCRCVPTIAFLVILRLLYVRGSTAKHATVNSSSRVSMLGIISPLPPRIRTPSQYRKRYQAHLGKGSVSYRSSAGPNLRGDL